MLTIARTLMGNPAMIILDEPSEGLAPVIVEQLAETIQRLKSEGVSILLAEQNLNFARTVCDRAAMHARRRWRPGLHTRRGRASALPTRLRWIRSLVAGFSKRLWCQGSHLGICLAPAG